MATCTPKSFDLTGKVALITGASYGIGMAIAKAMAANGATIVFNDIKQELVDKGLAAYKEAGIGFDFNLKEMRQNVDEICREACKFRESDPGKSRALRLLSVMEEEEKSNDFRIYSDYLCRHMERLKL